METKKILVVNPGSTSTKVAVYENNNPVFSKTIEHSIEELSGFEKITDQFLFRKEIITKELKKEKIDIGNIEAIVGRGGLVHPIPSGVYEVNDLMIKDLRNSPLGEHASNLGGIIAKDLIKETAKAKAFIADPVVVDELNPMARVAGHPAFERKSIFHALNQKAVARRHAKSILKKYENLNLIVVHLGGGISIGAHQKGRVVDVNQALDGEGPFSPERSGTLPSGALVRLCFSGKYTEKEVLKMVKGKGGLAAHLGTNSANEAEENMIKGDEKSKYIFDTMAYQVSKEIGAMCAVLNGCVDGILLTGGIANSKYFVNLIMEKVHRFAPVHTYPGGDEMDALAMNGLMALNGEIEIKEYKR